jgi:hypothetical protein
MDHTDSPLHEPVEETQATSDNPTREETMQEEHNEEDLLVEEYLRDLDGHVPILGRVPSPLLGAYSFRPRV